MHHHHQRHARPPQAAPAAPATAARAPDRTDATLPATRSSRRRPCLFRRLQPADIVDRKRHRPDAGSITCTGLAVHHRDPRPQYLVPLDQRGHRLLQRRDIKSPCSRTAAGML